VVVEQPGQIRALDLQVSAGELRRHAQHRRAGLIDESRRVPAGLMAAYLVEQTHPLQHGQLDPTAEVHRVTALAQCRGELDHGDVEPAAVQPVRERRSGARAPEINTRMICPNSLSTLSRRSESTLGSAADDQPRTIDPCLPATGTWAARRRWKNGNVPTRTGNRTELARFLRSRREALTPAQVGLPAGVRRRTPGLRRDEVAELASMSTNYYEKLEQARGPRPSPTVLDAIAGSLRLSVEEREHLYLLAEQPLPAQGGRRGDLDAGLVMTMESLTDTTIAMIVDDLGTVLAQNRLSVEVFGRLADQADHADNMVWRWFTDPAWRASWAPADTHDATAAGFVADLRALAAQRGDDPATARFIDELRAASDEFAQIWDQHDVYRMQPGFEVLHHPQVGRLALQCGVLQGRAPGQRLFLFRAAAGTPTSGRLAALARRS
jgi:transcriptional regulator with XRE-family HTH domain